MRCAADQCRQGRERCDRDECVVIYLDNSAMARFLRWILRKIR